MGNKVFTCTDLYGNEVSITYKTVLSAFDQERIDEVYMQNLVYNPQTQKTDVDWRMGNLPIRRQNAIIENVVTEWSLEIPPTPENIKKALSKNTFAQFIAELEAVVSEGEVDQAKKKSLPES